MHVSAQDTIDLAIDLHSALTRDGGATIHPDTGEYPTTGYVVSVPGAEARFAKDPGVSGIRAWMRRTAMTAMTACAGYGLTPYLGAWKSPNGETVLDVSIIVEDRAKAMALGREYRQEAIFDLDSGTVITL